MKCAGESEWTLSDLGGSGAEPLEENDPRRIGGIPLAGRLGAGGMGRVYLGVHEGRYVAVKQVLPSIVGEDKDFLRRFGHELDNLARLPEEATARLIASDRTARPPWLATAYVPGLTLREALELHGGPLPADALWLLLREAAEGLASVHALDMVHRDLKPSNVMLTVDGATLIDFGVARAAEQSQLTRTGMVVGTPAYMAPEQAAAARQLSGATDVFALGSVMAYAASGTPPFGDESGHAVLYRIVHEEPDLAAVRAVDPELAEIVEACLDKDGEARPTAAELLRRATERGPFTAPLWPEIISRQLSAKAEFAANVQEIDVPSPGPGATHPAGRPAPEPQEGGAGAEVRAKPRERRRRTRIVFAVVPAIVVLGGTTLAVRLLPYTFDAPEDQARATPSVSATGPAAPGPVTTGGSPSGTVAPGKSPGKEKAEGTEGDESGAKGKEDGEGSAAGEPRPAPRTGRAARTGRRDRRHREARTALTTPAARAARAAAPDPVPPVRRAPPPAARAPRPPPEPIDTATVTTTTASSPSTAARTTGNAPPRPRRGPSGARPAETSSCSTRRTGSACPRTCSTRRSSRAPATSPRRASGVRDRAAAS